MTLKIETNTLGFDIFAKRESSVRSYSRSFPVMLTKAQGSEVWDPSGRRYLDFLAGAGSLNYGHNNPAFKHALIDYISQDGIAHSLDLYTSAKSDFLRALDEVLLEPLGLDYLVQFTGPTGTNAVEAAIKLARRVTGRTNLLSFTNGFHGVTMGSLSLTGNRHFRNASGLPLQGVSVMPYENYFGPSVDTLDYLEIMLNDPSSGIDKPAAAVVETVQGEGGINAASISWLKRLQNICRRQGILLIVDDIQAGCGRTGTFFSFTPAGIEPDIVTLSKSLSGYGLPLSVVLYKRELDVWKPGEHNGTFRGNNHAFITAAAALYTYWRSPAFVNEIAEKAAHLGRRLELLAKKYPDDIPEVRGRGMMRGLVFNDANQAADVAADAFKRGLIIERSGAFDEVIKFLMPLTTSKEQLDEGLDIVEAALKHVLVAARRSVRTRHQIAATAAPLPAE